MDEIDQLFSLVDSRPAKKKKRSTAAVAAPVEPAPSPAQIPAGLPACSIAGPASATSVDIACSPTVLPQREVSMGPESAAADRVSGQQTPPAQAAPLALDKADVPMQSESFPCVPVAATLHGSQLLRDMFARVPPDTLEARLSRPLLLDVTRDRSGFAAAKRAGLLAAYLNSATVSTPGLPGSNRPLGRRASIALATAPAMKASAGKAAPAIRSLAPFTVLELHALWRAYAFRLTASLAATAKLDPAAAASQAAHPDPLCASAGKSVAAIAAAPRKSLGATAGESRAGRGAFVLEDLSRPGASSKRGGGGGAGGRGAAASAVSGIKRLRAVLDGAASAADASNAPAPAIGPPVASPDAREQPQPVLVGDAEVAAYSARGFSAQAAGRLLGQAAVLPGVDWRFAAVQVLSCPRRPALEGTVGYVLGVSRAFLRLLCPRPPDGPPPGSDDGSSVASASAAPTPPWVIMAVPLHDAELGTEWPTTLRQQPLDAAAVNESQPSSLLLLHLKGSLLARAASTEGFSPSVARDLRARRGTKK